MIFRLLILVAIIAFAVNYFNKDEPAQSAECKIVACELGFVGGCIPKGQVVEATGQCITDEADICYKQYGSCVKQGNTCGWQQTEKLTNCVGMIRAAESLKNRKFDEYK